ncbi:MAG: hypothetical protein M3Y48_22095 [Actinomycetota bacterium]|nr:hypothetical protein [Actinomycetota bacterium]
MFVDERIADYSVNQDPLAQRRPPLRRLRCCRAALVAPADRVGRDGRGPSVTPVAARLAELAERAELVE